MIKLGLHGRDPLKLHVERASDFDQHFFEVDDSLLKRECRLDRGMAVAVAATWLPGLTLWQM